MILSGLLLLPEALSFEFDAVGIVDEAIEDRVGDGGVSDDFVPAIDGQLAGDDNRTGFVSILDDFEQITALVGVERFWSPVVLCGRPLMASTIWHFERLGRLRSYVRPLARIISPLALMKSDNQGVTSRMRALKLTRLVGFSWFSVATVVFHHAFLALTKLITLRFGCGWPTLKVWRTSRCGSILRFSSLPR